MLGSPRNNLLAFSVSSLSTVCTRPENNTVPKSGHVHSALIVSRRIYVSKVSNLRARQVWHQPCLGKNGIETTKEFSHG